MTINMIHEPRNNCVVSFSRLEVLDGAIHKDKNLVKIFRCETHDVEICHCGKEWGKHEYNQKEYNIKGLFNLLSKVYKKSFQK